MDFMIDTVGDTNETIEKKEENSFKKELFSICEDFSVKAKPVENKKNNPLFKDLWHANETKISVKTREILYDHDVKQKVQDALKMSVLTPDFEKLHTVPPYEISEKKLREQRRKEREKTKGAKWFGLPATEMTEEIKNDLEILQMRSVLDPKHFYKKNDMKVLPKYFQIGKVVDSPLDFYNSRLTKKERKRTLVDELLTDAEFNKFNKRKYKEIIEEKQKTHYKAWRKAKKLKKKK